MLGRGADQRAPAAPSVRLLQVLATYCRDLHPTGLNDLRRGLRAGQYPWLREELAAAIRHPDQANSWWTDAIGRPTANPAGTKREIRSAQRRLWRFLFADEPFPT